MEPERRDFWDDFSTLGSQEPAGHRRSGSQRSQRSQRSDVVGTAALRKGPTTSSLANSTPASAGAEHGDKTAPASTGKSKDEWDDNW
jgi:ADP-ribosylation factor GTPase-activating protein 1